MIENSVVKQRELVDETTNAQIIIEIFDNFRRVFQAVQEQSKRVERETGLTGPQAWTMRTLADHGPIKISDIARRMYLHVATVVGIIDRLEIRGFVRRTRDLKDRRVVHVELTEEGRSVVSKAPQVAQGMLLAGMELMPSRKLRTLHSGLEMMVGLLDAQKLPPKLMLSDEMNVQIGPDNESLSEDGKVH